MKASTYTALREKFTPDEIAELVKKDPIEDGYVITYYRNVQIGTHRHKEELYFLIEIKDGKPILTKDLYKSTISGINMDWAVREIPNNLNGIKFEVQSQKVSDFRLRHYGVSTY